MNSRNELFDYSKECIIGRRFLKAKVRKLTNEYIQNNCANYLKKLDKINNYELNNQKSINNAIKLGINFHFNKIHYNPINKNLKRINNSLKEDEIKLNNDYRVFCNTLKNDFSINELEAIKSDELYYIPDINIRSNLNLNRKTNLKKISINKLDILQINKAIYTKFCRRDEKAYEKGIKNIKKVKQIIKSGINKLKEEEKKKIMKKEKIRKILNKYYSQSKKEIHSLIKDERYKKILNSIGENIQFKNINNNRFNSTFLKKIEKDENMKINRTQNDIIPNIISTKKSIDPNLRSHSVIYDERNMIKKRIFNLNMKAKSFRKTSLQLSKISNFSDSSFSIFESRENLMKKRISENLQKKNEEEKICKKLINKIKSNYSKNTRPKLNLKYLIY